MEAEGGEEEEEPLTLEEVPGESSNQIWGFQSAAPSWVAGPEGVANLAGGSCQVVGVQLGAA